jgi:hypothetical protein
VNKVQTRYKEISLEGYAEQLPPGLGMELGKMILYIDEFGYVGDGQGYINWKYVSLAKYFKPKYNAKLWIA